MTIYKSHQVNLDPEPYRNGLGERATTIDDLPHDERIWFDCDPRPEFEPTRDPEPYWFQGHRYRSDQVEAVLRNNSQRGAPAHIVWAPRREQFDTPVNRVLVLFRRDAEHNGIDSALEYDWPTNSVASSADEIDHARRVLTRLANLKEQ